MKILIMDIGAGTMDVLIYDSKNNTHYKAVAISPIKMMIEKINNINADLLITGGEMGGGPIGEALKRLVLKGFEVVISESASRTIHHKMKRVKSLGIRVVSDEEAEQIKKSNRYHHIYFSDIDKERVKNLVYSLGLDFSFDIIGVCAQDHGIPPEGISHLEFRHRVFKERLDIDPEPGKLIYRKDEIPPCLNRLKSIAQEADKLGARNVFVMDSGMCAINGGMLDQWAHGRERFIVIDIATSHTLCATIKHKKIAGFFEYHTSDITRSRLEELIVALAHARISHKGILKEGGHGAYVREPIGFDEDITIIVTGPKREILKESKMQIIMGAPFGDNMMTGTSGLLNAILNTI